MLVRAKSDAELAIALTREEGAKAGAQGASVQSNNQQSVNAKEGCSREHPCKVIFNVRTPPAS